jgi:aryl-alcohol dehydrogenase-like predicted oxidoreductase
MTKPLLGGPITLGGDLTVGRLGFGAMRTCGPGIWGEPADPAAARAVLRRAVDLGVTFIDTADAYGPETNERQIADALYPYPAGLVIATKGGLTRPGPSRWEPDGRPAHLTAACEASLKRLRLQRIDLYQWHAPDPRVPFMDSLGALIRLREAGKIRHIGLSNVTVAQLRQATAAVPIAAVQNRYNLDDRTSEPVLQECERLGIAFLPWYPLAAGAHAGKGLSARALASIAREHRATTAQVALAWLLAHSPLMLPIPGTSSIAHLEENLAAADLRLNAEQVAELT